jgi:hypothetical protein
MFPWSASSCTASDGSSVDEVSGVSQLWLAGIILCPLVGELPVHSIFDLISRTKIRRNRDQNELELGVCEMKSKEQE